MIIALCGLGAALAGVVLLHHHVEKTQVTTDPVLVTGVVCAGIHERPESRSPLVTQSLLGWPVQVQRDAGRWLEVVAADKTSGWVQSSCLGPETQGGKTFLIGYPSVPVLEAPQRTAASIGSLYLGSLVHVEATRGSFAAFNWVGGRQGWLAMDDLLPAMDGRAAAIGDGSGVVARARSLSGTPYLWGGMTSKGIDCSGLAYVSYLVNGLSIPRDADAQFLDGKPVEQGNLQPGDLVFFALGKVSYPSHVGIYVGHGYFINARSRQGVTVNRLDDPYFSRSYLGARRFFPVVAGKVPDNSGGDGVGHPASVTGIGEKTGLCRVAEKPRFDDNRGHG